MSVARIVVTVAGLAAIVWVLWYFLAPARSAGRPSGRGPRAGGAGA